MARGHGAPRVTAGAGTWPGQGWGALARPGEALQGISSTGGFAMPWTTLPPLWGVFCKAVTAPQGHVPHVIAPGRG